MHNTQKNALRIFQGVAGLAAREKSIPELQVPLAQLTESTKRVRELALAQDIAAGEGRKLTSTILRTVTELRRGLLRPVVLAMNTAFPRKGGENADIRRRFSLPRGRMDYSALILSARSMAQAVEQYEPQFSAAGIPQEYVTRIRAAADALEGLLYTRGEQERGRMSATQELAAETRRGMSLVRLISAMVVPTLQGEPGRAAEWAKAVRTNRPPQPAEEGEEGGATAPATTGGTPPADVASDGDAGTTTPAAPLKAA